MNWLPDILYVLPLNKVSYNICIWKMRIQKVGVIWQNIKLHLFSQISMTFRHGPSEWVSILDWSHAGADGSHTQIYFSIIIAFHLLSRVLSAAGNDLYSVRSDAEKLNHFTCLYPLGTFVPVPKKSGRQGFPGIINSCKQCINSRGHLGALAGVIKCWAETWRQTWGKNWTRLKSMGIYGSGWLENQK